MSVRYVIPNIVSAKDFTINGGAQATEISVLNTSGQTDHWVAAATNDFVTGSAAGDGGLRVSSGKNMLFGVNTTEIMRFNSDGGLQMPGSTAAVSAANTGRIRYNSSSQKFEVSQNGAAYVDMVGGGSLSGTGTSGKIAKWSGTSSLADSVIAESSSSVGINTTSMTYKDTNGGSNITARLVLVPPSLGTLGQGGWGVDFDETDATRCATGSNFYVNNTSSNRIRVASVVGDAPVRTAGSETGLLLFYTKPSGAAIAEAMRINSSQQVSIGTTIANATLNVLNGIAVGGTAATSVISWESTIPNYGAYQNVQLLVHRAASGGIGGTLRIMNGNGGSGASARLQMSSYAPAANPSFELSCIDDGAFGANMDFKTKTTGADGNSLVSRLYIRNNGTIGINTTSPSTSYKLHVEGGSLLVNSGQFVAVNSGDVITTTNNTDTTFILSMVGSGQVRFKTDLAGRYMSFADGAGTTDRLTIRSGRVGIGINDALNPPAGDLYIARNASGAQGATLYLVNNSYTTGNTVRIAFNSGNNGSNNLAVVGFIDSGLEGSAQANYIGFGTLGVDGNTNTKWTISGDGSLTSSNQTVRSGTNTVPVALMILNFAAHGPIKNQEFFDIDFNMSRNVTYTGGGSFAVERFFVVRPPTILGNAGQNITITEAATMAITGAPVQGTDSTLTNRYAFWVQAGLTKLDGSVDIFTTGNAAYAQFRSGQSAAVSDSSTGRIRYNASTQHFEISENGGAYAQVATGAGGGITGSGATGAVTFWTGTSSLSADSTNFFWDNSAKRLGLGTNAPAEILHALTSGNTTVLSETSGTGNVYPSVSIKSTVRQWKVGIGASGETTFGVASKLFMYDGTANAMRMVIDTAGFVGINNNSPASILDVIHSVNGNAVVQISNTNAGTSSSSLFRAVSDTQDAFFGINSAAHTNTLGAERAFIYAAGPGISLRAVGGSGNIKMVAGGDTNSHVRLTVASDGGIEFSNSNAAGLSASNTGRVRYSTTNQRFEVSENGGSYTNVVKGVGTANTITKFTATGTVGDSSITDNGTTVTMSANVVMTGNIDLGDTVADVINNNGYFASDLKLNASGVIQITKLQATGAVDGSNFNILAQQGGTGGGHGGYLQAYGGNATGSNKNGGYVVVDAGTKTGTGVDGKIQIGTVVASAVELNHLGGTTSLLGLLKQKDHSAFSGSETVKTTGAVQTTDATQTTLKAVTLVDTAAYWVYARVVARESTGADRALYERKVLVYREGGGATIEGSVQTVGTDIESSGASAWDITFTTSSNDIQVSVTGAAATTINWSCTIWLQPVLTNT